MDFGKTINLAWRIVKLEKPAAREAADDPQGLLPTLLVIAIGAALCSSSGILLGPMVPIGGLLFGTIVTVIAMGCYHLIALALGGKATYGQYLQSAGLGCGLVAWAGVVPFLGFLAQLWQIPTAIIATEEVHGLDRTKAVLTVLIPSILLFLCCCATSIFFWGALISYLRSQDLYPN